MSRRQRLRVVVSFRRARGKLGRFMTGSFAVHALLFALLVIVPASRHKAMPIEDTMVVALAGPISPAPAAASAAAPPAAKPATPPPPAPPPPKEAHTVREVPIAKPKEKPAKTAKAPEPTPAPAAPPSAAKPSSAKPSSGTAGTGTTTAPPAGSGAVTAMLGTGDPSLSWYGASVKAALEAAWTKPVLEEGGATASVVVTFEIARDGATSNIKVAQSSGIPSLDRSAQRAVIEASPLPGIPPTWNGDSIPVTMKFELTPDAR